MTLLGRVSRTPSDAHPALAGHGREIINAGAATSVALLNCLVREACTTQAVGTSLHIRLAGTVVRTRLIRPDAVPGPRLGARIEEAHDNGWVPVDWRRLTRLAARELELRTGQPNPEFAQQVASSHATIENLARARRGVPPSPEPYLDSEQALIAGHRFHPSPKAREGAPGDWLPYAPEARARFRPHWLAIREDVIDGEGDTAVLDDLGPDMPAGYRALPVHPWQLARLWPRLAHASGLVIDLGAAGPEVVPTSSVRTCYVPDADVFLKFSLGMRITNCVRKNAWYELSGAVALTRLLRPVAASLSALFDECGILAEPGYRSVLLADRECHEGLGVIVREGVRSSRGTPLLAAAIADPYASSGAAVCRMLERATDPLGWWASYVRLVVPPVLHAYLAYGVVLEPHLQNVLVAVGPDSMPVQAIFRDMEGTKLLAGQWRDALAALPPRVAAAMTYEPGQGWNRVVYCLFVNHLAETAAAIADLHPGLEAELWRVVRQRVETYAQCFGPAPELRALLASPTLPAKANLRTRWTRSADRASAYVPIPNPLV